MTGTPSAGSTSGPELLAALSPPKEDGRRRRTDASRARLVSAMISLIEEGDFTPRAERVAERAGVGLRTVFRIFRDMDGLYAEMHRQVLAEVEPLFAAPLDEGPWPAPLRALIARRAQVFDHILALRCAGDTQRHRSAFLQQSHQTFLVMQRKMLTDVLPAALKGEPKTVDTIDAAMSFDLWRYLRMDQQKAPEEAERLVWCMVAPLAGLQTS